jgi:hypothetical protein
MLNRIQLFIHNLTIGEQMKKKKYLREDIKSRREDCELKVSFFARLLVQSCLQRVLNEKTDSGEFASLNGISLIVVFFSPKGVFFFANIACCSEQFCGDVVWFLYL